MPGGSSAGKYLATRFNVPMPLQYAHLPAAKRLMINKIWETGIKGRLPRHYVKFYQEWQKGPLTPIHSKPNPAKFVKNEFGQVVRVQDPKLPVLYPDEFHQGLWGGEGVVKGFQEPPPTKHNPNYKPPKETYYWPKLFLGVVHSEVLNVHLEVVMTLRGQRLIDESYGLDNYLLRTPVNEVYSLLGLKIKREILLRLAHLVESGQDEKLVSKYETFVLPRNEADWHGLSLSEAIHKQLLLERQEDEAAVVPLKKLYRQEVFSKLKEGMFDDLDPDIIDDDEQVTFKKYFKSLSTKFGGK